MHHQERRRRKKIKLLNLKTKNKNNNHHNHRTAGPIKWSSNKKMKPDSIQEFLGQIPEWEFSSVFLFLLGLICRINEWMEKILLFLCTEFSSFLLLCDKYCLDNRYCWWWLWKWIEYSFKLTFFFGLTFFVCRIRILFQIADVVECFLRKNFVFCFLKRTNT